jgi:hypothetical protein
MHYVGELRRSAVASQFFQQSSAWLQTSFSLDYCQPLTTGIKRKHGRPGSLLLSVGRHGRSSARVMICHHVDQSACKHLVQICTPGGATTGFD